MAWKLTLAFQATRIYVQAMADIDSILKEIQQLEKEAYQRGRNDAAAEIFAAASQIVPVKDHPAASPPVGKSNGRLKLDIPVIEVIRRIIKKQPGLRGSDVFREAVAQIPDSNLETMERTGRTVLARLKKRGQIMQRSKKWYPKKQLEENR